MPEVFQTLIRACERLDMKEVPELYIEWNYTLNAMACGVGNRLKWPAVDFP